MTVFSSSWTL